MEITLIKLNENTLEVSLEKVVDVSNEFKDKEIFYDADGISIVCKDNSVSTLKQYKKLLMKDLLKETIKELNNAHDEVCKLNRRYIDLVNKLI